MRAAAATVAALMLLWLVVAVLLLALGGCSPRVPAVEPATMPLPWCFRAEVRGQPKSVTLAACAETLNQCAAVRELARRRGGMAGLISVGECR